MLSKSGKTDEIITIEIDDMVNFDVKTNKIAFITISGTLFLRYFLNIYSLCEFAIDIIL